MIKKLIISFFILLFCNDTYSQLQANFTIDKPSGCSPLDVKFTNTTTGATAGVTYTWDFGNGNSSNLVSPGATYTAEQVYTVTLTATDGGIKSTISKSITVYKKPTVNFSVSPAIGCVPLTVKVTSTSTAGDGTISNYLWDFGDGKTASGKNLSTDTNTYTVAQNPPLSLTVTNSFGCFAALSQPNALKVLHKIVASFTPSTTQLCAAGSSVSFTNTSTGDGVLTYLWDFGDGQKSNAASPTHTYSSRGNFIVRLTVSNDAGCVNVAKLATINVGNFTVDFSVPNTICANQTTYFSNRSTKPYDSIRWQINSKTVPADTFGNLSYKFLTTGVYQVSLSAFYKECIPSVVKDVTVGNIPTLKGFIVDNSGICTMPITFTFTDTTADAVKWQWRYLNNSVLFDTNRISTRVYADSGLDRIGLTVVNKYGCTAFTSKAIRYYNPNVALIIKNSSSPIQSPNRGCPGLNITFSTTPVNEVIKFNWDFGDGSAASTKAEPTHIYNTLGSYSVKLTYETRNGCKGTLSYDSIYISQVAPSDFTVSPDTLICGNSEVNFTPTVRLPNVDYVWYVNGAQVGYALTPGPFIYHFQKEGYYTIKLVVRSGSCMDSLTKVNYVHVLPPFPDIQEALNTCSGTRGPVVFTDSSRLTNSWHWNFGDGTTKDYTSFIKTLTHVYTGSGTYKVKLTATNGSCVVTDSMFVNVLLKQKPKLSTTVTHVCVNDTPILTLSGFDVNPMADTISGYTISKIEFSDLTASKASLNPGIWSTSFSAPIKGLETDKQNLHIITTSKGLNCQDTSNFIPLKTGGPVAAFTFNNISCFSQKIVFTDASVPSKISPIIKWEWMPGDSTTITNTNNRPVTYKYPAPGNYFPQLRITDSSGCTYETAADSSKMISITGPVASFTASDTNVLINTTVNFKNTSTFINNTQIYWQFPNNTLLTDNNPSFEFQQEGSFTVLLVVRNTITGCTDTAKKVITVKRVQSIFNYTIKYSGQNNCPPLLATFTSSSLNAAKLKWDFGDGGQAEDKTQVTHVYTAAGLYSVTLYSIDEFGRMDSSSDIIEVKGPYAILHIDTLSGCGTLPVKLSADTVNAVSFRWDFGDGTIIDGKETSADHIYNSPGVYTPGLILSDVNGCTSTSASTKKITLDSMRVNILVNRDSIICDSAILKFNSEVYSMSQDKLNAPLSYLWTSSLTPGDIFTDSTAIYYFNHYGVHQVTLTVTSPYGCHVEADYNVDIKQGVIGAITGPAGICIYDSVFFKGTSIPSFNGLLWNWDFANGQTSLLQNPPAVKYSSTGIKNVRLVVSNKFCSDTALYTVDIRNRPAINLTADKKTICLGDTGVLTATGGINVNWKPSVYSISNGGFIAQILPSATTKYIATINDEIGCVNSDSILITVISPLKIQVDKQAFTCYGSGIRLNATGANSYQWTGSNGFSANVSNPFYVPVQNEIIKVTGYDAYNCFEDSAMISLNVSAIPTVDLGPEKRVIAGQEFVIQANTSSDVVKWNWSPATYLQCANCAAPLCKPLNDITYTLQVTSNMGCIAVDSITIQMVCGKDLVYIPTGFTPNGDNLNDRFAISGGGVTIRHFAIFDRWGKKVFERSNVNPQDRNSSWDGTLNGQPLASGAYVYFVDVICNTGETFTLKGTVTLIR